MGWAHSAYVCSMISEYTHSIDFMVISTHTHTHTRVHTPLDRSVTHCVYIILLRIRRLGAALCMAAKK